MTWQSQLRDTDPAAQGGLTERDVQAVRRTVVAAAREPGIVPAAWPRPFAVAAMVILMIASGVVGGRRLSPNPPSVAPAGGSASIERRQLQFATPGGTRIIWTFDSQFGLRERMP